MTSLVSHVRRSQSPAPKWRRKVVPLLADGDRLVTEPHRPVAGKLTRVANRLYATTTYPYTASSPLLAAYDSELIDLNGSCE